MEKIAQELNNFSPIALEQMDNVKLLKRYDTKLVFPRNKLLPLLEELSEYYYILEINGDRLFNYENLYFDTNDYLFYHQHHNKNFNRYKIRFREYKNSGLCYFEVKIKNNKGKTIKKRLKNQVIKSELCTELMQFVNKNLPHNTNFLKTDITPKLWTIFSRITLVNKTDEERVTIDLNLGFKNGKDHTELIDKFVIVELKQKKLTMTSPAFTCLRNNQIRPTAFSKYCMGTAMLNKEVKINRFKPKLLAIQKIIKGA